MKKAIDYKWHNYWELKAMQLIWLVISQVGFNKHFDNYLSAIIHLLHPNKELLSNLVHVALTGLKGVEKLITLPLGLRKNIDKEC